MELILLDPMIMLCIRFAIEHSAPLRDYTLYRGTILFGVQCHAPRIAETILDLMHAFR